MPEHRAIARKLLLDLYAVGLAAVDGAVLAQRALQGRQFSSPVHVIALGKAAVAMAQGARHTLGGQLADGLIITRHGYTQNLPTDARFTVLTAGHPVPDAASLAAGTALLDFLHNRPQGQFLFLISGGTSSLCEVPAAGIMLADLQRATRWLLGRGLPIEAINTVRGFLSAIKNGGLLNYLEDRQAEVLLLSDVAGDDPAIIGSGLLHPAPQSLPDNLPDWLQALLSGTSQVAALAHGTVRHKVIGNNITCLQAIAQAVHAQGRAVYLHETPLAGAAESVGVSLVEYLRGAPAGIHLWGGETTVVLPANPGQGGRCQQLALRAACELAGCDDVVLLAAGTDGSDGNSEDAGALIDGGTLMRGMDAGCDARECLVRADAGSFLDASGDLLDTGPTGTNVRDIVIALKIKK